MKKLFFLVMACASLSVNCNPTIDPTGGGEDTTHTPVGTVDTIVGWENAGLQLEGSAGFVYKIKCIDNELFALTGGGDVYRTSVNGLAWSKLAAPDGAAVYTIDTAENALLMGTKNGGIYKYSPSSARFQKLSPPKDYWPAHKGYSTPYDSTCWIYEIVRFRDKYIALVSNNSPDTSNAKCSDVFECVVGDTVWTLADSGWNQYETTVTTGKVVNDKLYFCTYGHGLFEYDGTTWRNIPGTRTTDTYSADNPNPGVMPRAVCEFGGELYLASTLYDGSGYVTKLKADGTWVPERRMFYSVNNKWMRYWTNPVNLFAHNGLLFMSNGPWYRDFQDSVWKEATPYSDSVYFMPINPSYNGPPGVLYEVVAVGDTLFAAVADVSDAQQSGVYRFDLNKASWYRQYKARGNSLH